MSGFSTSASCGGPLPSFLSFCSPASAVRQSATAAAKTPTSAGSAASTAPQHVARAFDAHGLHAGRIGQRHRARHERDAGAGRGRCARDGVALLAGGAVRDVAHRIDRLVRRARRDEDAFAGERLVVRASASRSRRSFSIAATISSGSAMRPMPASPLSAISPRVRTDGQHAVGEELLEIALRRLVRPHARVHRGREQDWLVGREQHGGREIVGVAVRHLGHQVGGRGRDHDQIVVAREPDVPDVELAVLDRTAR